MWQHSICYHHLVLTIWHSGDNMFALKPLREYLYLLYSDAKNSVYFFLACCCRMLWCLLSCVVAMSCIMAKWHLVIIIHLVFRKLANQWIIFQYLLYPFFLYVKCEVYALYFDDFTREERYIFKSFLIGWKRLYFCHLIPQSNNWVLCTFFTTFLYEKIVCGWKCVMYSTMLCQWVWWEPSITVKVDIDVVRVFGMSIWFRFAQNYLNSLVFCS